MALYERGLGRLIAADTYPGLLACTHIEQLYDHTRATIPGYSAKYVKSSEMKPVQSFIEQLRLQKLRLKADLRAQPDKKPFIHDKLVESNAKRLAGGGTFSPVFLLG